MATLDELVQQAIAEKQKAPTEFGQQVLDTAEKPTPQIHIDGIPFDQFFRERQQVSTADDLISQAITAKQADEGDVESLVVRTPVPETGDFALDNRGRIRPSFGPLGMSAREVQGDPETFPQDFEFDSEEALKLQRAREGVDFRRGLPFLQRLQIATSSPIPRAKAQAVTRVLSDEIKKVPEGIPALQYDPALGQFYIALQISDEDVSKGFEVAGDIGKFRYVALEGAGVEFADVADLMNLGEIGSIAGAVVGAGKSKLIPFFKGSEALQTMTGGFAGGLGGRLVGDSVSVAIDVMNSDGEFIPTYDELLDMGLNDAKIEALASVIGEGLSVGLRKSNAFVQDAYARMTGREGVFGSELQVAKANARVRQTRADLQRVRTVTGNDDLVVTRGQSAGSISMIELENSRKKNASPRTKRMIEVAQAKSDRATIEFVQNVWNGDLKVWRNRHGVVRAANRVIENGNLFTTQTSDGLIGIHPMISPDHGLKLRPEGEHFWQVKGASLPENLQDTGMGRDLYMAALEEARAHGAVLQSDDNVREGAYRLWRSIDGSPEFGKLDWNPNVEFNDTLKRWESLDGRPIVSMPEPDPLLPKLLDEFMQPQQARGGKIMANKEFARFLRRPGRGELGQVMSEIENNRFLRQQLKEAIFEDYTRNVSKGGKFSVNAFEDWKDEVGGMLERVFTPEEMLLVRKRGGIRALVERGHNEMASLEQSLRKFIPIKGVPNLRDPAVSSSIYKQLKNMDSRTLRRTAALLREADMLYPIQELVKEDFKDILVGKVANRTVSRKGVTDFKKFIRDHETLIRTLYEDSPNTAQQYIADLRIMSRMQDRKSLRTSVVGTREEANPSALAFTRVAFGPLSRAQRFLTAARRYTTRRMGEAAVDMISDPDKLRLFLRIKDLPMQSKQVTQALPRLLGHDFFDAVDVDWENPEEREAFIREINRIKLVIDEEGE